MKKQIMMLILMIGLVTAHAVVEWDEAGISVFTGNNSVLEESSVITSDGNCVIFWTESRAGFRSLLAQKIDENGNKLWQAEGVQLAIADDYFSDFRAISNQDNEVYLAYLVNQKSDSNNKMFLQKLAADGEKSWGEDGKEINGDYQITNPSLLLHLDGDLTVSWGKPDYYHKLSATRVHPTGVVADGWGEDFSETSDLGINLMNCGTGYTTHYQIALTEEDGIFVSGIYDGDIYLQKVTSEGTKLFGNLGTFLVATGSLYDNEIKIQKSNDAYYLVWEADSNHLNLIKLSADGEYLWDDAISFAPNISYFNFLINSNEELIFALYYPSDEVTCLKLSNSGELIWENQQIEDIGQAKLLEMSLLEDDEILLSYTKEVEYPLNGYYLQKISDDGELLFAEEGLEIKQVNYRTASVKAIINNYAGKIFCFWNESVERESQIDLKMVDYFGNFISEEINIQTKIFGSVFDYQIIGVNNGPIYYWRDNSDSDNQKLVVQKLDEEGNKVFADKGIDLFPNHKPGYNNYDVIFSEADNLLYAILIDENSNAIINVIDQFGNFVGEDLSFEIESYGNIHPRFSGYNNDIFVTWVSYENDSSIIKMQKISDGEIAWSENKELLASDNFGFDQYLLSDDYLIVNDLLPFPERNLSVYRFTEEGELHPDWPTSGVTLAHQANISQLSVADSPNGKLISWTNYLDTYEKQINLQIVNSDGSLMWEEPITNLLANYATNDIIFNNDIYLTTKTDDSIIKLQKYSLAGEIVWEDEVVISENATKFSVISLADNLAIIWQEEIADDKNTIRLQAVTPDGTKIYEEHGIAIYNESSYLESPQLVFDGEFAYTGIIDYSSMKPTSEGVFASGQLLAQKLSLQTLSSNEETISPNAVLANYPNPFNPTTTISFSLPNAVDNCQLAIYNLRGQKVKTLLNQPLPRGEHSYVWDGRGGQGQPVSSGVYLYQIVGADFQLTRKMLLLK